ncbi:MAG: glycosyltransferase family 4 protein [Thermoplasmataceae archaeon]
MKILIVSPRFIKSDMRGGEEVARTLFLELEKDAEINVITSDGFDIKYQHSFFSKSLRGMEHEKISDPRVIYLTSFPLINSLARVLFKFLKHLHSSTRTKSIDYLVDLLSVFSHGPYLPSLRRQILKIKPDVIFGSIFPTQSSFSAFKIATKRNIPFVYTPYYHYMMTEFHNHSILREIICKSSSTIACTKKEKDELIQLGSNEYKTHVIPLGIPIKQRPEEAKVKNLKNELKLEDVFIVLAQAWIDKGIEYVVESVSRFSDIHRNVALVTIGSPDLKYLEIVNNIKSIYKNLRIINLGWVQGDYKNLVFSMANVFMMFSKSDAFGLSYLEALSMKVPVMGMRETSAEEIVTDSMDGYLINEGDIEGIMDKLEKLYTDHALGYKLGDNGLEKVRDKFSDTKMKENYMNIFEVVVKDLNLNIN